MERGGRGPRTLLTRRFPAYRGVCTDTGGGGAAFFWGWGAEGVTQSSPKANAWSWARRLPRAGPATPSVRGHGELDLN